jgi:C4-dicarboxylate-specific signal transduction histidine kinase
MGLGVAICKKIAAEYDGSVTLENAAEGGCRAVIRLRGAKICEV